MLRATRPHNVPPHPLHCAYPMEVQWGGERRFIYHCGLEMSESTTLYAYRHREVEKQKIDAIWCECDTKAAIMTQRGWVPTCLDCKREGGFCHYAHLHYTVPELYCNCLDKGG